ncbi:MAG TPA: O-antigen ligase family protein [Baekduia sp.]|nr:O-antigen ligase family protein [Baekduia sp.]
MSTVATPSEPRRRLRAPRLPVRRRPIDGAAPRRAPSAELLYGLALTAALTAIGLRGGGGLALGPTTAVEMALDVAGGLLAALAVLAASGRRWWGGVTVALFVVLLVVTALSITWAVQPSDALIETHRTVAYVAVFGSAVVVARLRGGWWRATLGAVCAATTAISLWAVLTKVFPGALAADEIYARLRQPYGYWNAVGLTAAMGLPPALWLGARRSGHAAVNALAYPMVGVLLVATLLSYSRGSLLAAAVGCAFWLAVVPLRLRGIAVLATGAVGALLVTAWAFAQDTLTEDNVSLDQRMTSGHELGLAVLCMILVLLAAGLAIGFGAARRAPRPATRRRAGAAVAVAVALVPIALVVALAMSDKGLGGSISSGWKSLTDPNDQTRVYNDPSRLTSVGSVRARYWDESLKIWRADKLTGAGAGGYRTARLRYRTDRLAVRHAHGYVVQTAADLGIIGLAASLALFVAWLVAVGRTLGWRMPGAAGTSRLTRRLLRRPPPAPLAPRPPSGPEHVALATLAAVVVVFGVSSFIDWTWYVPGTAVMALAAAGWVAGRGPAGEREAEDARDAAGLWPAVRTGARVPWRAALAVAAVAIGLLAAWSAWQPLRATQAENAALAAVGTDAAKARALTETARDRNPYSIDPLVTRAIVENAAKRPQAAREALVEAVRLQPSNPASWTYLASFELSTLHHPKAAIRLLGPALHLDPQSPTAAQTYVLALRAAGAQAQQRADRRAQRRAKRHHDSG